MLPFLIVPAALAFRGVFFEPCRIKPSRHRIRTRKLRGEIRVVHLTDLHLDRDTRRDHVPLIVNALRPDLVVMTGDYLNSAKASPRLRRFVQRLQARLGVYACFGNWDRGKEDALFHETAVVPLRDHILRIDTGWGESIGLIGVDFDSHRKAPELLQGLAKDDFNIFLHHTPDLVEEIAGNGPVDLYLAGHTHGGQVRVPFLRAFRSPVKGPFPYHGALATASKFGTKYESGRFHVGQTTLYVNRGLGMEGGLAPRVRLFCFPEIAVFDIGPAAKALRTPGPRAA
jgi:predicted MPP superfamily phosphohydrolase